MGRLIPRFMVDTGIAGMARVVTTRVTATTKVTDMRTTAAGTGTTITVAAASGWTVRAG